MNFLIVSTTDLLGTEGLIVRYRELSKALGAANHVHLIGVTYKKANMPNFGPKVHVYPINMLFINRLKKARKFRFVWQAIWASMFYFKCFVTLTKIFISKRIDACLSYTAAADPLVYFVCRLFRVFWIYDVRGLSETELPHLKVISRRIVPFLLSLEYFCSAHASKILVGSGRMKEMIISYRNIDSSKVGISEDGVDTDAFNPLVPKGIIHTSYNIPESDPIILYVGSISLAKGIDRVIGAMPYLLEKFPTAKLVVVGGGSFAVDDSTVLRTMVKNLGIEKNVVFTGRVKHPAPFIVDADVCVAPSYLYFSPIKIYEYLACAKPVVIDKRVDIAELLVANDAAMPTDTTNYHELASTIASLLSDKELSQKVSSNGYKIVVSNFTWTMIAKNLTNLVQLELSRRKHS